MKAILKTYGLTIGIAVFLAMTIRTFMIEAYRVPTSSMKPTLEAGDTVFVLKWVYGSRIPGTDYRLSKGRSPQYGEVVVFTQPDESARASIRRVLGLPGDQIEIEANGQIKRNQVALTREPSPTQRDCFHEKADASGAPYLVCNETPLLEPVAEFTVPPGFMLVMGDLRTQWADSEQRLKSWQVVPLTELRARAFRTWVSIEPSTEGGRDGPFSRIRFDRMLKAL